MNQLTVRLFRYLSVKAFSSVISERIRNVASIYVFPDFSFYLDFFVDPVPSVPWFGAFGWLVVITSAEIAYPPGILDRLFLDDFVYGLKGNNGEEWFLWLENLVYHLLILSCVYKVAAPAVKKLGNK